jgi:3-methylcrotonyl-CoA carboxylase alpha subunit
MSTEQVTRLGTGIYRVDVDGLSHVVYVAGATSDLWAYCAGAVFHEELNERRPSLPQTLSLGTPKSLAAPMPATVAKVLVQPGSSVRAGATVVVLEAMKMELPIRATSDGIVAAVHCREGELVQGGAVLVELI